MDGVQTPHHRPPGGPGERGKTATAQRPVKVRREGAPMQEPCCPLTSCSSLKSKFNQVHLSPALSQGVLENVVKGPSGAASWGAHSETSKEKGPGAGSSRGGPLRSQPLRSRPAPARCGASGPLLLRGSERSPSEMTSIPCQPSGTCRDGGLKEERTVASRDKAKWPRQGLTINSVQQPETVQKLYKYLVWPLEKTLRNCIHKVAKLLKILCPPTFPSVSPISLPHILLPKAQPHSPAQGLSVLPSLLLCLHPQQPLCAPPMARPPI